MHHHVFGVLATMLLCCSAHASIENPLKRALIKNETDMIVHIAYRSNDPGFLGSHAIIPKQQKLGRHEEATIFAYSGKSEDRARALLIFGNPSNPELQTSISIRHNEIISIIALASSGFHIYNTDETQQYFWYPPTTESLN